MRDLTSALGMFCSHALLADDCSWLGHDAGEYMTILHNDNVHDMLEVIFSPVPRNDACQCVHLLLIPLRCGYGAAVATLGCTECLGAGAAVSACRYAVLVPS